jgi:hypothetical protein
LIDVPSVPTPRRKLVRPSGPATASAPPQGRIEDLRLRARAELATVPALRRAARGWLNRIDLDAETAEDVVMATGEAVTNAVEHAYPHDAHGTVRLVMTETPGFGGGIEVQVGDDGRWQEPPTAPGFRGAGWTWCTLWPIRPASPQPPKAPRWPCAGTGDSRGAAR